jgi:hypothetical protein
VKLRVFGLILAVAIFAIGALSRASGQQIPNQPAPSTQVDAFHKLQAFWDWLTQDSAGFFTAALGLVAVIQVCLFLWQLILIKKTLKAAQDSASVAHRAIDAARKRDEILERAYLWPGFGHSRELDGGKRREWRIRVWNSGKTVGVLKEVRWAVVEPEEFEAGKKPNYTPYIGREDVIPPSLGKPDEIETGIIFTTCKPMVCCGWIVWEDIFGNTQRQGWKHTLNLKADAAGNYSIPFTGAYSRAYRPWESE